MSQNNPSILHVGLDVAKLSLQLHLAGRFHSLANDPKGHAQLLKLLRAQPGAHVVCEATGGYEQPVVQALQVAGGKGRDEGELYGVSLTFPLEVQGSELMCPTLPF